LLKVVTNSVALVRKRTIPTERPPLVGGVSANFSGQRVSRRHRNAVNFSFCRPGSTYSTGTNIHLVLLFCVTLRSLLHPFAVFLLVRIRPSHSWSFEVPLPFRIQSTTYYFFLLLVG
jgi:hypothetical protein